MSSSEARSSSEASIVINVNFIGQGIKGIKELRGKALQSLNDSPLNSLPNAQRLLNKSPEDSSENYFVIPTPPTRQRQSNVMGPTPPTLQRPNTVSGLRTQRNILKTLKTLETDYKEIFLNSDKVLKINSVNCGFKIVNDFFYKVQISEVADPLINEVVFSIELTKAMTNNPNNPNIFPIYYDHFTIPGAYLLNEGILKNKTFKCLVTEALANPISLEDKINNAIQNKSQNKSQYISNIISDINILMTNYKYYGETLGFIHSDLHMCNIQVNKENNYKIIDFGRCFMFDEENLKQKYTNTNTNQTIFNKFNIKNNLDFSNPFRLVNLIDKNKESEINIKDRYIIKDIYICKGYAYLCDVAQVAFGLLIDKVMLNKNWFKLINYSNCNKSYLKINLSIIYISKFNTLDHGLLWLSCYLIASSENNYKFRNIDKDLNNIFGKYIFISKDTKNFIYEFDLENMIDNTLLLSNLMFNPNQFNQNRNIQAFTVKFYEMFTNKNNTVAGGSNKNLKNKISKHKHNKMNGGHELEAKFLEYLNDLKTQNEFTYVNEINGLSQIEVEDNSNLGLITKRLEEEKEEEKEYIPNPEITKNLGKSVYQIFFEELEKKPELFNQFFEKKECEPCDLKESQACEPCHKAELITGNIIPTCSINNYVNYVSSAAGGGSVKSYVIHLCKETKRKYIRKSNTRWYLDENRGKYKYLNQEKTRIVLRN